MADIPEELAAMVDTVGFDELLEHMAMDFRNRADEFDETDQEIARKWRVRGNGVMQALRFYQAFIKERNAE